MKKKYEVYDFISILQMRELRLRLRACDTDWESEHQYHWNFLEPVFFLLTAGASAGLNTADYNITFNSNGCVLEGEEHLVIIGIDHLSCIQFIIPVNTVRFFLIPFVVFIYFLLLCIYCT